MRPIEEVCRKEGICEVYLAKKLKRELNAKETKVFNPKGNSKAEGLIYSKALVAWDIRQKARMDAQKLLSLYPPEKHEVKHDLAGSLMEIAVQAGRKIQGEKQGS